MDGATGGGAAVLEKHKRAFRPILACAANAAECAFGGPRAAYSRITMTQLLGIPIRPTSLDRVVYGTITLMSVLVVYDGWQHLRLLGVIAVIVGPILAMFVGHVFASLVTREVEVARPLTARDYLTCARTESRFLLICVPPTAIVSVLFAFGVAIPDAIQVTLWVGAASLGLWGWLAGRRAGYKGWRLLVAASVGLIVGLIVLTIHVILERGPGH